MGLFDAHKIFDEIPKDSLETQPLKIDIAFYSYKCGGMATGRTCPSDDSERLNISGTRLERCSRIEKKCPLSLAGLRSLPYFKNTTTVCLIEHMLNAVLS